MTDALGWLEENNSRTSEWLRQQHARYTHAMAAANREGTKTFVAAYLERETCEVPISRGAKLFYAKRPRRDERPHIYVKSRDGEQRLKLAHAHEGAFLIQVAESGGRVAIGRRRGGRDEFDTDIVDLATQQVLGTIDEAMLSMPVVLSADLSHFLALEQVHSDCTIWRNSLAGAKQVIVRFRAPTRCTALMAAPGERYLLAYEADPIGLTLISPGDGHSHIRLGVPGNRCVSLKWGTDALYLCTDWGAPMKRLVRARLNRWPRIQWEDVIPEWSLPIRDFSIVGSNVYVVYASGYGTQTWQYDVCGQRIRQLEYSDFGTATAPQPSADQKMAHFKFSSLRCPPIIYELHPETGRLHEWHREIVPFDANNIAITMLSYSSSDGTEVPLLVAHRKDVTPSVDAPTMLSAYGGFGFCNTSRFSTRTLLWIAAGGVYASAQIRGGGEKGSAWHQAGRGRNRMNAFDDFVAAAQFLIRERYTSPAKLAIVGGSNAGLLVGVALTQRPDLFRAAICVAPMLDMLRFHLFSGGHRFIPEFGNPDDPLEAELLRAYSPYHNVKDGMRYPAVMIISGDSDTRCHPMHARKMTARLQAASASARPIVLNYRPERGHAGNQTLSQRVEDLTDQLCFLFKELDMTPDFASFRAARFLP